LGLPNATSEAESSNSISAVNQSVWPSCWTVEQKSAFRDKNDWLFFHDGKLGCSVCKNCGYLSVEKSVGMRLSKEWIKCEIASYGDSRKQQLTTLRKKILTIKKVPVIKQQLT
jgi:hypothetical protein